MVDAPGVVNENAQEYAQTLGVKPEMTVLEVGWDEDCDNSISEAIEDAIGGELLEDETDELCDVVLLWWREEDGDLVDGLVDSIRPLADNGCIWLLTPGAGKDGTVAPGEISESAQTAGLVQTTATRIGNWQGSCLVSRGYSKK
ncbi:DUF3052 domain-containing protein [Corynebacterium alimapuense]|uniref:DUF3052 domain-containing protein n=1 Tax=Corynebacterium alimapuense TaxID=1576874 RepID=A0A3M8K9J3_9CORY|nr:DUF3052 domain-containing protein [Corynebacterium alimapuense]RNE49559.1 DUF3052 domain-containing protein [Corynebacterium alimapuense]